MKIVTGGQTGVDLAALQFALENDIPYGGWVPKGRTNEDGQIPGWFTGLVETSPEDVSERTKLNVRDSDALLVFQDGAISPGTQLTIEFAQEIGKPHLVVDLRKGTDACARQVRSWLMSRPDVVLNIAGPRSSEAPQIGSKVTAVLKRSIETKGGAT
ncbi:putative molybdenum carrier protein [Ruegeria sp. Ofav3-42]|uniref:putative molybdenum carrier protein n=1 Tax=Ruegeria sp. Ofav3-42 TaxID=2917759 RepID=UPI001EF4234A|nr:putative molybdenum carrier protein [Ruegeria sp. Ofav3-42]